MVLLNRIKLIIANSSIIKLLYLPIFFFRLFKIKKNRILCSNFMGKGYGDSPKYISEELAKDNKYEIIWICKNINDKFPNHVKPVKIYSLKYFYYIATSKFWIFNTRTPIYYIKRKKQIYIQTWHGCLAFKKIEFDVKDKLDKKYVKNAIKDTNYTNLMISNSSFCNELYKRAFRYSGKIMCKGTPRNDLLVGNNYLNIRKKVCRTLNIPKNNKIILYAPTFRAHYDTNPYDINFEDVIKNLKAKYHDDYSIIIRMHPGIKNPDSLILNYYNYINANNYDDMQELILASDLLITDYSSTMFEAMIANKPVIIYANDIKDYNEDRGSYFKINELPFPASFNNDELLKIILNTNFDDICNKYNNFKDKIGLNESGKSSVKIKEYIDERIL